MFIYRLHCQHTILDNDWDSQDFDEQQNIISSTNYGQLIQRSDSDGQELIQKIRKYKMKK